MPKNNNLFINFNIRVIYTLATLLILFVTLVVLNVNGSSISYWNNIVGKKADTETIFGTPKGIRSDEYAVQSPFIFSQVRTGFQKTNESLGPKTTPVVMGLPTKDISAVFRPQLWGFYFLNEDRGLSFFWNFLTFSLLVAFFLLLMLLTKNNYIVSCLLTVGFVFSSFIQWWLSTQVTLLVAYMALFTVAFVYMLFTKDLLRKSLYAGGFAYCFIAFCLILYPPFQITLLIIFGFLVVGLLVEHLESKARLKGFFLNNLPFVLVALLVPVLFLAYYYVRNLELIRLVQGTIYPGKRAETGGNFSISRYYSGIYNFIMTTSKVPQGYGNISSASNFIILAPLAIIFFFRNRLRKDQAVFWLLSFLFCLFSVWIVVGMPSFLAKMTMFSLIPPNRMFIGLGVLNFLLLGIYLSRGKPPKTSKYDLLVIFASMLFSLFLALLFNFQNSHFLSVEVILVSVFALSLLSFLLYKRLSIIFSVTLLIFIFVPSLFVNPVSIGTGSLTETNLSHFVREKAKEDNKWVVYNSISLPNYIKAQGAAVINGVNYAPDFDKLKVFDEEGKYKNIYNRYAYIALVPGKGEPEFKLVQQDVYSIKIDPCGEELYSLGVKYFVFTDDVDRRLGGLKPTNTSCLTEIYNDQKSGIIIYARK
jgi:hypothetical protein